MQVKAYLADPSAFQSAAPAEAASGGADAGKGGKDDPAPAPASDDDDGSDDDVSHPTFPLSLGLDNPLFHFFL